jgi:D-serine deaminase-like pyridoxal phosphate-dependent protein
MAFVVTGLSQSEDIGPVSAALRAAGLPTDPLQAVGPDDSAESVSNSGLVDADIIEGDEGTRVPGISSGGGATRTFFRNEDLVDRLGDFGIPESELDNYLEAVERGKTVVAYFADAGNADKVSAAFAAANLANVRTF